MGAKEKVETRRTSCDCGKGQFVFYASETEPWLYADNPQEKWFEIHIYCKVCADKYQKYMPTHFSLDEGREHWNIIIPEPNQVPPH